MTFLFDNKFEKMNESGIDELRATLDEANAGLDALLEGGEIDAAEQGHLLDWMERVLEKLTIGYENVSKGVEELMATYIMRTRTDDILDQGRAEGRAEGQNAMIESMLKKGKTPEEIVDLCSVSLQQVKNVEWKMLSM